MSQSGYILISDITGYTHYLSDSELEHAEEVLRTLLEVILEETDLPLVVSRLEGDAVISYALSAGLHDGDSLVERIENTYVAFRRALQQMASTPLAGAGPAPTLTPWTSSSSCTMVNFSCRRCATTGSW